MIRERLSQWADYIGGIGLALVAASAILFLLNQPRERLLVLLAIGIVLLALYVYARTNQVREMVTARGVRYGSNALILTLAFIGVIVILNFLSTRYSGRYDLTANKSQSLSDLTIKVLQDLKAPVRANAFYTAFTGGSTRQDAEDKLKQYARFSDKFTYRFVDPQAEPQIANDYKVQFDGTIVLERGNRRENAISTDEQALTNAIIKVSSDKQPVLYFTTGHGEHSADDSGDNGFSSVKSQLEGSNLKIDTINLRTITSTLPSDISALVIAGPRQKFGEDEVQRVKDYLDKNGRVLLMVDPQTDTGLESLLKGWGLNLRNDVVIDLAASFSGRPLLLLNTAYKSHATTQDLAGLTLFLPNTRSLVADTPPPSGRNASALFSSSPNSWGETNFDSLKAGNPQFDANADAKGPVDLGYAVEGSGDNPPRLVVLGNSTFITNVTLRQVQGTANELFTVGVMNWLAGQENLIAIPPKLASSNPVVLNAESSNFIFVSSFCLLPGAILAIGAIVWWRRR